MLKRLMIVLLIWMAAAVVEAQDEPLPLPQLAYLDGGSDGTHCQQVTINGDGTTRQQFELPVVSGCMPPVWSPDGAFLVVYFPGLMVIEVETGETTVLNDLSTGTIVDTAVWSHDGTYLAWHEQGGGDGANPTWKIQNRTDDTVETFATLEGVDIMPDVIQLMRMESDGLFVLTSGAPRQKIALPDGLDCTSTLAWYGSQFLCTDGNDLILADIQSGTLLNLTNTPTVHESSGQWSPDGQQIVYQTYEPTMQKTWLNSIRPDGSSGLQLTLPEGDAYDVRPRWSPDGTYIAFQRHSGVKGLTTELYVMQADGSDLVKVGDGQDAAWQPVRSG